MTHNRTKQMLIIDNSVEAAALKKALSQVNEVECITLKAEPTLNNTDTCCQQMHLTTQAINIHQPEKLLIYAPESEIFGCALSGYYGRVYTILVEDQTKPQVQNKTYPMTKKIVDQVSSLPQILKQTESEAEKCLEKN